MGVMVGGGGEEVGGRGGGGGGAAGNRFLGMPKLPSFAAWIRELYHFFVAQNREMMKLWIMIFFWPEDVKTEN